MKAFAATLFLILVVGPLVQKFPSFVHSQHLLRRFLFPWIHGPPPPPKVVRQNRLRYRERIDRTWSGTRIFTDNRVETSHLQEEPRTWLERGRYIKFYLYPFTHKWNYTGEILPWTLESPYTLKISKLRLVKID